MILITAFMLTVVACVIFDLFSDSRPTAFSPWLLFAVYACLFPIVLVRVALDGHHLDQVSAVVVVALAGLLGIVSGGWPLRLYVEWRRRGEEVADARRRIDELERRHGRPRTSEGQRLRRLALP